MFLTAFGAIIWQICILHHGSGYPHNPNSNESVDSLIQTQLIDLQNPETQNLLRRFNVSADKIKFNRWSPRAETDSATLSGNDSFSDIKQLRFHDIKIKINNVMHGEPIADGNLPTHEMVAFPICTQVNTTTWKDDTNLTIRFAPSLFETVRHHMYLDKAVLRLFKVNPYSETEVTPRPACDENPLQNQIRVTISTIQYTRRNKREKKKRICNTLMLNTTRTGWIDIDIKKAIYIWEKSEHTTQTLYSSTGSNSRLQVMSGWLSIDVHDEDERQLNAGLYFEPPKCEEFRQYHGTFTDNLSLHLQWKRCSGHQH